MIIERRKRHILLSQTEKQFGLRTLCETIFVPETNSETDRVSKFVREILASNEIEDDKAAQMRNTAVASVLDWATNMQLDSINKHLANLRTHPSFDELIKDISQLITDVEEGA